MSRPEIWELENLRPGGSRIPPLNSKLPVPVKSGANFGTRKATLEDKTNSWRSSDGTGVTSVSLGSGSSVFTRNRTKSATIPLGPPKTGTIASSINSTTSSKSVSASAASNTRRPAVNSINMSERIGELEEEIQGLITENQALRNQNQVLDRQKKDHELEVNRLKTDRSEWDLERRKLEDSMIDMRNQYEQELLQRERGYQHERAEMSNILEKNRNTIRDEYENKIYEIQAENGQIVINLQQEYREELQKQLENKENFFKSELAITADQMESLRLEKTNLIDRLELAKQEFNHTTSQLDQYAQQQLVDREQIDTLRAYINDLETAKISNEQQSTQQASYIEQLENQIANQGQQLSQAIETQQLVSNKLIKEEILRRKLHNQIQELKGNIRVFCRIRPSLPKESSVGLVNMSFPDKDLEAQQLIMAGPTTESAMGNSTSKVFSYQFDRVFSPSSTNQEIFDEISQLVQSALDGYNVCIFAYGQTGSGKTFTMSEPENGMIPQAVKMIFETAESLKERGWMYELEGQFVEIYNETLHDLLSGGSSPVSPGRDAKLEIRHDSKTQKTTVIGLTSVTLDSPARVEAVLKTASDNRSVASTKANERSSRSHSVFMLRIRGENSITGHSRDGTLNLIDLAGSERLAHSQATGDRLKETQAINKSLSSLGDVISALGSGAGKEKMHIPYRNSKLTYLLQNSLSGDSKTLMFVNISPLEPHVNETVSSLRFATKVNDTRIR